MISSEVTSLYTNIVKVNILSIIQDYVNNDDQFIKKEPIPQDKFHHLVGLTLTTTWYPFNPQFYQQTDAIAMGGHGSLNTTETYMQVHEGAAISMVLHPPKFWG